jgi:uncharacterized protein
VSGESRFLELERVFAAHLRDPDRNPAPEGIEDRRLAIYRNLFFNNIRSLLGGVFKVTRKMIGEAEWTDLAREFYTTHRCITPIFLELPGEFSTWFEEDRGLRENDPPFLLELVHYEWVNLRLTYADAAEVPPIDEEGDLLQSVPIVSPLAWTLMYRYPVHRVSPNYRPEEPPATPTFLVAHRNPAHQISHSEINAVAARLLELLDSGNGHSGREALEHIAAELPGTSVESVVKQGGEILGRLRQEGIILGTLAPL